MLFQVFVTFSSLDTDLQEIACFQDKYLFNDFKHAHNKQRRMQQTFSFKVEEFYVHKLKYVAVELKTTIDWRLKTVLNNPQCQR